MRRVSWQKAGWSHQGEALLTLLGAEGAWFPWDGPRASHGPCSALQQCSLYHDPHESPVPLKPDGPGQTQLEGDLLDFTLSKDWGNWVGKCSAEPQPPGTWWGAGRWDDGFLLVQWGGCVPTGDTDPRRGLFWLVMWTPSTWRGPCTSVLSQGTKPQEIQFKARSPIFLSKWLT